MTALTFDRAPDLAPRATNPALARMLLVLGCFAAGVAPIAVRWIPDASARTALGIALLVTYAAFAVVARSVPSLSKLWSTALGLSVFALVWLLNNTLPAYVGTALLHDEPTPGNPFASTVTGSVVVQLLETVLTVAPVLLFVRFVARDVGPTYVRKGVLGRWLVAALVFFALFYVFVATIPLRPGSFAQRLFPLNSTPSFAQFIALSPALLIMALSNGFEEEFLFRGLLLPVFNWSFNPWTANLLQAALFAVAHLGVTYTPSAIVFVVCIVLPLGLVAGYLTRKTQSLLTPAIFHGALDIAIYLTFLTATT